MSVYLLYRGEHEDRGVEAVYASMDAAMAAHDAWHAERDTRPHEWREDSYVSPALVMACYIPGAAEPYFACSTQVEEWEVTP